jgi:hypothetical protein
LQPNKLGTLQFALGFARVFYFQGVILSPAQSGEGSQKKEIPRRLHSSG